MYARPATAVPVLRAKAVILRQDTPEQQEIRLLKKRITNLRKEKWRYKTMVGNLLAECKARGVRIRLGEL